MLGGKSLSFLSVEIFDPGGKNETPGLACWWGENETPLLLSFTGAFAKAFAAIFGAGWCCLLMFLLWSLLRRLL